MFNQQLYESYRSYLNSSSRFPDSLLQKKFDEILSLMTNKDSSSSLKGNESEVGLVFVVCLFAFWLELETNDVTEFVYNVYQFIHVNS